MVMVMFMVMVIMVNHNAFKVSAGGHLYEIHIMDGMVELVENYVVT